MKLLFDFFPALVFFLTYKLYDFKVATVATMIASVLQVAVYWMKYRKFEKVHLVTVGVVLLFGGATLLFDNALFMQWKPTVVFWLFGLFFLGSHFFGKKNLLQHMLDSKVVLSNVVWVRLNYSWIFFFLMMGTMNLWVVYNYDVNTWMYFKLFGIMGLTLVFVIFQAIYISKNLGKKYHARADTN